jgi:hypothetical protein
LSEDVRSLMVLPSAAQGGLQDLQQGVTGLIEGIVHTNLQATQELFRLTNPGRLCGAAAPVRAIQAPQLVAGRLRRFAELGSLSSIEAPFMALRAGTG